MVIIFLVSAINFRILSCNNYNPNIYCLNISTDFVPHLTAHLLLGFSTVTCLSAPNQPGSHCHLSCIFAVAPSSHFQGEQHFVHTYKKHVHSPSFYSQIIHSLKGGRAPETVLCVWISEGLQGSDHRCPSQSCVQIYHLSSPNYYSFSKVYLPKFLLNNSTNFSLSSHTSVQSC